MSDKYPWYEVVEGGEIEQGDILFYYPVVELASDVTFPLPENHGSNVPIEIKKFDLVIMTQSCDLVNDKVEDVILCPHWDLSQAGTMDQGLANKDAQAHILKGRRPRYLMLDASKNDECSMNVRIVDFGRIYSSPKKLVRQFVSSQNKRLRLCPPYREYLSQGFARFFMRVGLPQEISLP